jgi:hypothetical protein
VLRRRMPACLGSFLLTSPRYESNSDIYVLASNVLACMVRVSALRALLAATPGALGFPVCCVHTARF